MAYDGDVDEAPFELVGREGDRLTVRCARCGTEHVLPPLGADPHSLTCECGNAAQFLMAPARPEDIKAALEAMPDRSRVRQRRVKPSMN